MRYVDSWCSVSSCSGFGAMADFRPAQEQEQHPGEEHLMQPIPEHKGKNYKAAGKLQVRISIDCCR